MELTFLDKIVGQVIVPFGESKVGDDRRSIDRVVLVGEDALGVPFHLVLSATDGQLVCPGKAGKRETSEKRT